jgi:hypothetical protein
VPTAKDKALYDSRETILRKLQTAIDSAGFFYQHKAAILSSLISFTTGVLAGVGKLDVFVLSQIISQRQSSQLTGGALGLTASSRPSILRFP